MPKVRSEVHPEFRFEGPSALVRFDGGRTCTTTCCDGGHWRLRAALALCVLAWAAFVAAGASRWGQHGGNKGALDPQERCSPAYGALSRRSAPRPAVVARMDEPDSACWTLDGDAGDRPSRLPGGCLASVGPRRVGAPANTRICRCEQTETRLALPPRRCVARSSGANYATSFS